MIRIDQIRDNTARTAHTDMMGVVNNARYLEYFEAGRNDLLRNLGMPYTELEKRNVGLPVIEAFAKFITGKVR